MKALFIILTVFIAGVFNCSKFHSWPSIQLISSENTSWTDGIFYDASGTYRYVDRLGSSCYLVDIKTGETIKIYLDKIENMFVAFDIPLKSEPEKGVIAANNKIFPYDQPSTRRITFQEPITVTDDIGYYIHKGHADSSGRLTIIMKSKADKQNKGGRLYTFDNKSPVLTKQFDTDVEGFVLSPDEKTIYIIADYGRTIYKFGYNIVNGGISNEEKVFELESSLTEGEKMTGIEIDTNEVLYVTTNFGYILFIDSKDGTLIRLLKSIVTYMTGITFGFEHYSGLFITTTNKCDNEDFVSGKILHVYDLNATGIADYPVVW